MEPFLTDEYPGFTFAGEAFDVEVSGLNSEHFTFTGLPTFVAVDDWLLRGVVGLLRMGHCKENKPKILQPKQKVFFPIQNSVFSDILHHVSGHAHLKSYQHFI